MLKLIVFFCLVLSTSTCEVEQEAKTLVQAPQWQLLDAQGNTVNSKDYAGKPLVIHFWATWCPYCKKLQPGLDSLYKKYQAQGLEMIAISFWEDPDAKPQVALDERGISFKTLIDGDTVAKQLFAIKGTPTTIFIDKQNQIVAVTRISDPLDPRLEKVVKQLIH
jgi:cytochrome c biogenesis protein CcmG/thiol:disulfide interchange protein DsbE